MRILGVIAIIGLFLLPDLARAAVDITDEEMAETLRMQKEGQTMFIPNPDFTYHEVIERERWPGQVIVKDVSSGVMYVKYTADRRHFAFATQKSMRALLDMFPHNCSTRHKQILTTWEDLRFPNSVHVIGKVPEGLGILFAGYLFLVAPNGLEERCKGTATDPKCAAAWQRVDNIRDPFDCK